MGSKCYLCESYAPLKHEVEIHGKHIAVCGDCYSRHKGFGGEDPINSPPHYIFGPYEVTPILLEWLKKAKIGEPSAALWTQLMQYLLRYPFKGGLRDLKKAEWYLKKLMEITND